MEQIGYSLIDSANAEIQFWGDTIGVCPGIPEPVLLPNNDAVHCAKAGDTYSDWRFVERWMDNNRPSPWHAEISRSSAFDGTKVIVTASYEAKPSLCPESVSQRQARLALLAAGLLDQVQAAVDAAGGATKITWEYAADIHRNSPMIEAVGQALKLPDNIIDILFQNASTL